MPIQAEIPPIARNTSETPRAFRPAHLSPSFAPDWPSPERATPIGPEAPFNRADVPYL